MKVYVIYFLVVDLMIFLLDFLFLKLPLYRKLNKKKKGNTKLKDVFELSYIITKFKLDKNKMPIKKCLLACSVINAFIIGFTVTVISFLDIATIWQFLIGFVLLFALIYALYEIFGMFCVRKGWIK